MYTKLFSFAAGAMLLFAASCKKSDDNGGGGGLSAGGLDAGKAAITFNTSSSGFGSFNSVNAAASSAVYSSGSSSDQITLIAAESGTSGAKTAQLTISLPQNSTTSSGNITGDFSTPTGATVVPVMMIGSVTTGGMESYTSTSGTITITKLSATEVEGSFSGTFENQSDNTTTTVTNGQFAGKFK